MLRTRLDQVLQQALIRLAVPAALILGVATVTVAPAQASPTADDGAAWRPAAPVTILSVTTAIQHRESGLCLDGSVSQGVRLKDCNGGDYQKWTISSNNRAPIRHFQSGRCLDGSISQGVRLKACNDDGYQLWDRGWVSFEHVQSGRCLDGSISRGVRLNACNGSVYQMWNYTQP